MASLTFSFMMSLLALFTGDTRRVDSPGGVKIGMAMFWACYGKALAQSISHFELTLFKQFHRLLIMSGCG